MAKRFIDGIQTAEIQKIGDSLVSPHLIADANGVLMKSSRRKVYEFKGNGTLSISSSSSLNARGYTAKILMAGVNSGNRSCEYLLACAGSTITATLVAGNGGNTYPATPTAITNGMSFTGSYKSWVVEIAWYSAEPVVTFT